MARVHTHPERLVRILSKLSLQDLSDLYSNTAYTMDVSKFLSGGGDVGYTPAWHAASDMARVRMRALRSAAKWNIGWRGKTVIRTGGTTGSGGEAHSRGMTMRMRPDTGPDRFSTPMHEDA